MARRKSEIEELSEALAIASAELRELRAATTIAFRHLNDNKNGPHYEAVGRRIQDTIRRVCQWFEREEDSENVLNLSGARKRSTLLEKREAIDRMLKEIEA